MLGSVRAHIRTISRRPNRWRGAGETLHAIEAGSGPQAELAHIVADAIVDRHLATMLRLGVEYDVLPRESEILHLQFWASAFALLKERQAIYFETEGKNSGCWVMPAEALRSIPAEDSKVIVRSDGTVTTPGRTSPISFGNSACWEKIFTIARDAYADGRVLWVYHRRAAGNRDSDLAAGRASIT